MHLHINLVMVLVSAVCQWILGALWYGVFFRKSWRKLVGLAEGIAIYGLIVAVLILNRAG